MLTSNYLIINRKPQKFLTLKIAGRAAVFMNEAGRPVDHGVIILDNTIYAALCCKEARNITIVTDRAGFHDVVTVLWYTDEGFTEGSDALLSVLKKRFSEQNLRINRYAEAIAEKLDTGVRLRVTDAVDKANMIVCPECGILNPAGSAYCLDCGADLQ